MTGKPESTLSAMDLTARWALRRDYVTLGIVMFDAVRHGASPYSARQRRAWVPHPRKGPEWSARLAAQHIRLSVHGENIVGFMSLLPPGYIDFAYIRPQYRGLKIFRSLYADIENCAVSLGATCLETHASIMAQSAFAAVGFGVQLEETVSMRGCTFKRYGMVKTLS